MTESQRSVLHSGRGKLIAGVLLMAALGIVAYVTGIVGEHGSKEAEEPIAIGPPPVISATGPVVPERRARLSFTANGRIKKLAVQPGDTVKQGQLLARLEPATAQANLGSAGANDLYLVAPFDGIVGLVPLNESETVLAGTPVVMLGDLSTLRVEIEDLSETDVGRLRVDQPVDITFEAFPGLKVPGRLARISPMNNAKGGGVNYDVVVEFVGGDLPALRWGMTAHADIRVDGAGKP